MKILIVDDEQIMRNGLRYTIDWQTYGFYIIDAVSNGKKALEICEKEQPDIVLTDIRMPVLDGLELTKILQKKYPFIEIVILSAYDDFKYAQEAMSAGAREYILKAELDCDSLLAVLLRVKERILEKKSANKKLEAIGNSIEQIKENLLIKLLTTVCYDSEIQRKIGDLGINIDTSGLVLIHMFPEKEEIIFQIKYMMKEKFHEILWLTSSKNHWIMLGSIEKAGCSFAEYRKWMEEIFEEIKGSMFYSEIFCGYSEVKNQNDRMQKLIEVYKFYEKNQIVYCSKGESVAQEKFHGSKFLKEFIQCLEESRMEKVKMMVKDIFQQFLSHIYYPDDIYRFLMVIQNLVEEKDREVQNKKMEDGEQQEVLKQNHTLREMIQEMEKNLERHYTSIERHLYCGDDTIRRAVIFMQDNIGEEITLQKVAKEIFCSPTYLSYLFKKKTGENFSEYIVHMRIKRAQSLLRTTDLSVSQIAEMVGIGNSSYFSKVFTKTIGISPNKYRSVSVIQK